MRSAVLLLMAATLVVAGFGYNTPITHIVKYAEEAAGISDTDAALLITYFGIGSTIGRVVLGTFVWSVFKDLLCILGCFVIYK